MIIRHDRSDRESLVDPWKWPAITSFFRGHGAASLIAPTWLLTAGHVASHIPTDHPISVEIAEKRYPLARVIIHPDYDEAWMQEHEDGAGNTVDLALVELTTPVEGVAPFPLYTRSDEQGQEIVVLGSGQYGDGLRGVRGSDRQLRRVTNIVDVADDYWLKFRFDAPPDGTFLEGVAGGGDSGGPALIHHEDILFLAGVSSWQNTNDGPLGLYGCVEHYTRVSRFVEWIRETCGIQA